MKKTGKTGRKELFMNAKTKEKKTIMNALLGGEGFFNTVVTGPGKVWLQTMPIGQMAGALNPYIVSGK